MTYKEATHTANVSLLRNLIKRYGINRSLGNVLTNEEAILKSVKEHEERETQKARDEK